MRSSIAVDAVSRWEGEGGKTLGGPRPLAKRILVIEDEPLIREVLAEALSGTDMEIWVASDGAEGLSLALREPPDAFVLDLMLPRMSGYEVLEALRRERRTQSIPIVVTTGRSFPFEKKKVLSLGADDFFLKPYELSALYSSLTRLLHPPMESEF